MGQQIEITTAPHELIIDGTTIYLQADPTAGPAWEKLLETSWSYETMEKQAESIVALNDALAGVAQTPEDGERLRKLELGLPTLVTAAKRYMEAVTGFPTQPPPSSTRSSKKT